jgi:hypothetical protein
VDWMEQSLEMMKSWTETQKAMWQGWLDASAGLGKTGENPLTGWMARWQEAAQKSMDVWEELTRKVVENEGKWAGSDAGSGFWPGREEELRKIAASWTEQTLAVMKSWTEAQRKLWASWFGAAATMAQSSQEPGSEWYKGWQDAAKRSMDAWDELTRKTMETQAEWFKDWLKPQPGEDAGAKKPASKKSPAQE